MRNERAVLAVLLLSCTCGGGSVRGAEVAQPQPALRGEHAESVERANAEWAPDAASEPDEQQPPSPAPAAGALDENAPASQHPDAGVAPRDSAPTGEYWCQKDDGFDQCALQCPPGASMTKETLKGIKSVALCEGPRAPGGWPGVKDGPIREWFPDGKLMQIGQYKKGKREGDWFIWSRKTTGGPVTETRCRFKKDKGKVTNEPIGLPIFCE
jgi:hypothetical protein